MSFFQNMISSIMKNGLSLGRFGTREFGSLHQDIKKATESVMSTTGEVSSIAFAGHLLDLIESQNNEDLDIFLTYLMEEYDINTDSLLKNVEAYSKERNNKNP